MPDLTPAEWPDWLPGLDRLPDDQYLAGRLPRLREMPDGLVVHSGARAPGVAEYLADHPLSAHVCWSRDHGGLVQQVPLTHRAQHAGPQGNSWWGLELSGPYSQDPRSNWERAQWVRVMGLWRAACGGRPHYYCRHSDIDPHKRDPGPGFTAEWADAVGLAWQLPG